MPLKRCPSRRSEPRLAARVPVVPAVVAAEEDLVAAGDAAGDAHRHGAGLAPALGVAHHLRRRHQAHQHLGQLHRRLVDDGVDGAALDLLLHGGVDHVVGVAQHDRAHGAEPVDVLVAVHVPDAAALGALGVDRADAEGGPRGTAADQLRGAGDETAGAFVDLQGLRHLRRRVDGGYGGLGRHIEYRSSLSSSTSTPRPGPSGTAMRPCRKTRGSVRTSSTRPW